MNSRPAVFALFAGALALPLPAQGKSNAPRPGPRAQLPDKNAARELARALGVMLQDDAMRNVRCGVIVVDCESGQEILESRSAEGFITASNMKLISSAVALESLGPKFRFETRLVGIGKQAGDAWEGDLVLVGSGDPTLGATRFEKQGAVAPFQRMAAALKKRGIREIRGRLLGDDDCQKDEIMGRGWDWSYHADWYAAQVGGLCFNENCIDVVFNVPSGTQQAILRVEPRTDYVQIDNRLTVASEPVGVTWQRSLGANRITLTGSLKPGTKAKRDWGSVHNPTAFAVTVLRETMRREGVLVTRGAFDLDEVVDARAIRETKSRTNLYVHRSEPLSRIVHALNKVSQNLYAEQLVRIAGRPQGRPASMSAARSHAKRVLERLGVDTKGMVLADGSGLSRLNLVKPRQLVALLKGMQDSPVFCDSLPVAGVDGTLRRRFPEGNPARARVRAKTGYVSRTVALSGYVPRQDRAPLAFSILVNDFVGPSSRIKELVDRFVGQICLLAGP